MHSKCNLPSAPKKFKFDVRPLPRIFKWASRKNKRDFWSKDLFYHCRRRGTVVINLDSCTEGQGLIPTHGGSLGKWKNLLPGQLMPCEGNRVPCSKKGMGRYPRHFGVWCYLLGSAPSKAISSPAQFENHYNTSLGQCVACRTQQCLVSAVISYPKIEIP